MMISTRSFKKHLPWMAFVAVLLLAIFSLDYSELGYFSPDLAAAVVKGLLQPKWSFFYDGSGEDLLSLLILTMGIAFLGTAIGTILALPLSLISSYKLFPNHPRLATVGKAILNVLRAFPELIYAILFVKMVGPGPFAGVMAIGIHQVGMLGKLFAEEMDALDDGASEAMRAVGANFWQVLFYARLPQLFPQYCSFVLNHFEIGIRSAATLGLVGAGGIGAPLIFAIQARNWDKVSIILLGVIVLVFVLDTITRKIRLKLQ